MASPNNTGPFLNLTPIQRAIEAGWLLAIILVPLAVWHNGDIIGYVQIPKIFLMRTLAVYLVGALLFEWALAGSFPNLGKAWPRTYWGMLKAHPARWLIGSVAIVCFANLLSLLASPVRSIGFWGLDSGWDTYALASIACYAIFFYAVATHLKTVAQLRRVVWALAANGALVGLYAISQHFGFDPFVEDTWALTRAHSSLGNPIFAGALLILTIPLTLAMWLNYRDQMSTAAHIWIGAGLIALPITGLFFALSRGPLVGMMVSSTVLLVALFWAGRTLAYRAGAILVVAVAFALMMTTLAVPNQSGFGDTRDLIDRVSSIGPGVGGSLNNRYTIWTTALDVWSSVPWADTELYPELPDIGLRPLHTLVGYGPDMFGYAYPFGGESTYTWEHATHGHSFMVHTMLELGLLGVVAYISLAITAVWILARQLRLARVSGNLDVRALVAIGLISVLVGRAIEQIPGKAQTSDLLVMWVLLGVAAALPSVRAGIPIPAASTPDRARRERRGSSRRNARNNVLNFRRLGVATTASLLLLVVWVNGVYPHPVAAAKAHDAQVSGNPTTTIELYREASDLVPSSAVIRLRLGQSLFRFGSAQPDPSERLRLYAEAANEIQRIIDRNPLDHRAWGRLAEIQREMAVTDEKYADEAIRTGTLLADLMPGFWQPRTALAWSYARIGDYEGALAATTIAKQLSADSGNPAESCFLHYVEAFALQGLDRIEDAIIAANRSIELLPNTGAQELLKNLEARL